MHNNRSKDVETVSCPVLDQIRTVQFYSRIVEARSHVGLGRAAPCVCNWKRPSAVAIKDNNASHSVELLGPPGILGLSHSKRSVSSPKCWDTVIEAKLKSDQRQSVIRCITPSRPTSDIGCNPPSPKGSDSAVTTPNSPAFVPGGQGKRKIWPISQGFGEGESEIGE